MATVSVVPLPEEASNSADSIEASGLTGVQLRPLPYFLVWCAVYALHAVCAMYLIAAGTLYAALPTTQVGNMFVLYLLTLDMKYFPTIAVIHYIVAAFHLYIIVRDVAHLLYRTFIPERMRSTIHERLKPQGTVSIINGASTHVTKRSTLLRRVYRFLLSPHGVLGVRSGHYEYFFMLREVIETALQTYQAYNMSCLLPRLRLNRLFTIILILNCWTTAILRRVFRSDRSLQMLICVLCDLVLDFMASITVPVVIAARYFAAYNPVSTDFTPWYLWYDDGFLINLMNEAPLVLFGTALDAISRLVFSLGVISSMADAKNLIKRTTRPSERTARSRKSTVLASWQVSVFGVPLLKPQIQSKVTKWVHRALVVWGFGIAVVFVHSQLRTTSIHCALELRPWLVRKPACAVIEINCLVHRQLTGNGLNFESILSQLDAGSVEYIVFRHCPAVEITPRIATFSNLYGIKTYNSTLVSWPLEAALRSGFHPRVRFAFFLHTSFPNATLPAGLQAPDFPTTLYDIEISCSNINWLPDTLPWPQSMTIFVEVSSLRTFPLVLSNLKPYTLSLVFNAITEFPAEAIMTPDIALFALSGNPITALPVTGVDITQLHDTGTGINLRGIYLEETLLTDFPDWVHDALLEQVRVRATRSPVCDALTDPDQASELLRQRPWLDRVNCVNFGYAEEEGLYPMFMDERADEAATERYSA